MGQIVTSPKSEGAGPVQCIRTSTMKMTSDIVSSTRAKFNDPFIRNRDKESRR